MRAVIFLWALAGPVKAENLPALFDVTGVAADDVLNLRAGPSSAEAIIGSLPPDARTVEVVRTSADGKWAVIATPEGQGYAARRFLVRQPGPDWFSLQSSLTCSGTEPFWSLVFDPARPVAVFSAPDGQVPFERRDVWPGTEHQQTAALALGDRSFAALRAEACSDGMSDRPFGIAVSLFMIGGTGPVTMSGCCSLQP